MDSEVDYRKYKIYELLRNSICRDPIGFIGALQTDEKYFGRGLGKLVVKSLAKSIAESGDDVYASIYEDNTTSRKLFARLGFEVVGEVNWIVTKYVWADE